jgi:hypothetical protein
MKKIILLLSIQLLLAVVLKAQVDKVKLVRDKKNPVVHVTINGKLFTDFFFPDTIAKQVLYPINAPNGTAITRGFPMNTKPGDPTDHPHHLGMWFNYGDVNGLDFWNNSYDIPADKKHLYGTIKMGKITAIKSGEIGGLNYNASWNDQKGVVQLKEETELEFREIDGFWAVDRKTTLLAMVPVLFRDNKEGLLGLRVAHELQIPTKETKTFVDANGIQTTIKAIIDSVPTGNYINSNGVTGEDVWGKKASWCMMFGKMGNDSMSVLILDHPQNIGYPTNWHARGYGLFAANPLGEKVFTNGKVERNLMLKPRESIQFRYRIIFTSGKHVVSKTEIEKLQIEFAKSF